MWQAFQREERPVFVGQIGQDIVARAARRLARREVEGDWDSPVASVRQ